MNKADEEHPSKAALPITVTLSGIVMVVRAVHLAKAALPIVVTPSGIVMDVSDLH